MSWFVDCKWSLTNYFKLFKFTQLLIYQFISITINPINPSWWYFRYFVVDYAKYNGGFYWIKIKLPKLSSAKPFSSYNWCCGLCLRSASFNSFCDGCCGQHLTFDCTMFVMPIEANVKSVFCPIKCGQTVCRMNVFDNMFGTKHGLFAWCMQIYFSSGWNVVRSCGFF